MKIIYCLSKNISWSVRASLVTKFHAAMILHAYDAVPTRRNEPYGQHKHFPFAVCWIEASTDEQRTPTSARAKQFLPLHIPMPDSDVFVCADSDITHTHDAQWRWNLNIRIPAAQVNDDSNDVVTNYGKSISYWNAASLNVQLFSYQIAYIFNYFIKKRKHFCSCNSFYIFQQSVF